jgi:hypothetical protein
MNPSFAKWQRQFGEEPERFWRLDEIVAMDQDEHPEWSPQQVAEHAQRIFETQKRLLKDWYNSQRRFYRHCVVLHSEAEVDADQNKF